MQYHQPHLLLPVGHEFEPVIVQQKQLVDWVQHVDVGLQFAHVTASALSGRVRNCTGPTAIAVATNATLCRKLRLVACSISSLTEPTISSLDIGLPLAWLLDWLRRLCALIRKEKRWPVADRGVAEVRDRKRADEKGGSAERKPSPE